MPRAKRKSYEVPETAASIERAEKLLTNAALRAIGEIREILIRLADEDSHFKSFYFSQKAPDDADAVAWVVKHYRQYRDNGS